MSEKRRGYVYVLHLDKPLRHACHYIGCTCNPRQRMITHAQGNGSNLIRAAAAQGIGFCLAALGTCDMTVMRRIERQVKDWHGAERFCGMCVDVGEEPRAIPGTQPYPLEDIAWPLHSSELAKLSPRMPEITYRHTDDRDSLKLMRDIKDLMQSNKHAMGWIPASGSSGLAEAVAAGRVVVAHMDSVLVGYCYFTCGADLTRVQQIVVADPVRGCGIGRSLLDMVRVAAFDAGQQVQARVRDDLHANGFWKHEGFELVEHDTHESSGQRLNVYRSPN